MRVTLTARDPSCDLTSTQRGLALLADPALLDRNPLQIMRKFSDYECANVYVFLLFIYYMQVF